ncbi:MAG: type IV pilus assembly protein PilW [Cryomorphaceae bacterium]
MRANKKLTMRIKPNLNKVRHQAGFTLVELMIGMVISLFVSVVSMTYMVSSSRMLSNQNSEDLIQENARFAFELMSSNIRLAGSNVSTHPNAEADGVFEDAECPGAAVCTVDSLNYTIDGTSYNSDRVAFDYIINSGTNCTGSTIVQEVKLVTVFFVADLENDGISSLYCAALEAPFSLLSLDYSTFTSFAAVPIIDGVDSLQIQYGIDTGADGSIDRYASYANVLAEGLDMANLRAVRIGLLVSSGQRIQTEQNTIDETSRTYNLLDSTYTRDDGVLRRTFSTTVFLPNMAG